MCMRVGGWACAWVHACVCVCVCVCVCTSGCPVDQNGNNYCKMLMALMCDSYNYVIMLTYYCVFITILEVIGV